MSRTRDEQEMRNGVEVMRWIEHLTAHAEVPISLDLICHFNRLILTGTERDYWAGRLRAEVGRPEQDRGPRILRQADEINSQLSRHADVRAAQVLRNDHVRLREIIRRERQRQGA